MPKDNGSFAGKVAFVTGAAQRHRPRRGAGFRARGRQRRGCRCFGTGQPGNGTHDRRGRRAGARGQMRRVAGRGCEGRAGEDGRGVRTPRLRLQQRRRRTADHAGGRSHGRGVGPDRRYQSPRRVPVHEARDSLDAQARGRRDREHLLGRRGQRHSQVRPRTAPRNSASSVSRRRRPSITRSRTSA